MNSRQNSNKKQQKMAPQNSTLINLVNDDDIKSISSERFSPIEKDSELFHHDSEEEESETDEEIPIFIGNVPRYVSGINRKTTCNDIIKALIDDELANANSGNNNTKVSKQLICEPQHYTIYERFQDIEHALDGDELIYDLWKNWGSRTDVQFRLKINKTKDSDSEDDRKSTKSKKIRNAGIQKLLKKVLQQGEMIQRHLNELADTKSVRSSRRYTNYDHHYATTDNNSDFEDRKYDFSSLPTTSICGHETATDTEDELFLVIENHNDNDSGVFITREQRFFREVELGQRSHLSTTPKRKLRNSRDFGSLRGHAINTFNPNEDFRRASTKFVEVHREIRTKVDDVKHIIANENSFIRKLDRYTLDDDNIDDEQDFEDSNCDNNKTMIV